MSFSKIWESSFWSVVIQSLSHVRPFPSPWTAAPRASLSYTISLSLLKLMPIESLMPSNHFILCHPLLLLPSIFTSIRVFFLVSQPFVTGGQSIGASASASVLPENIQDWFPLGLTGWISLQSKEFSRVFSNTTIQKASILQPSVFFMVQLSHLYIRTKEPLDESERGEWKSWLKAQHSEN